MWEASAEARFPIAGPIGGAVFVDASNVDRKVQLDFLAPHLSTGLGLRYSTPIGPVRVDGGYRLPFAQNLRGEPEEQPRETFGLPMAIHLSLGEAF
jgi:outer membrane protein insertion porin family/translocation and assembly module TamA